MYLAEFNLRYLNLLGVLLAKMDLNFYSELSAGSPSNVDSEYLNGQAYGGYSEENKVTLHDRFLEIIIDQRKILLIVCSSFINKPFTVFRGQRQLLRHQRTGPPSVFVRSGE